MTMVSVLQYHLLEKVPFSWVSSSMDINKNPRLWYLMQCKWWLLKVCSLKACYLKMYYKNLNLCNLKKLTNGLYIYALLRVPLVCIPVYSCREHINIMSLRGWYALETDLNFFSYFAFFHLYQSIQVVYQNFRPSNWI